MTYNWWLSGEQCRGSLDNIQISKQSYFIVKYSPHLLNVKIELITENTTAALK